MRGKDKRRGRHPLKFNDWQAYLDGSLSPDERAEAEALLASNPSARAELEGLTTFIGAVRDAGLREDIPIERLMARLPHAIQPKTSTGPKLRWIFGGGGLAVAAAMLWFFVLSVKPPRGGANALTTSDPVVAANWARERMDFDVPAIDLGNDVPLTLVHLAEARCCFDYRYKGNLYHVNVLRKGSGKVGSGREIQMSNGIKAYQGRGVRWTQGNWDFFVVGPDASGSVEIADRTSRSIRT